MSKANSENSKRDWSGAIKYLLENSTDLEPRSFDALENYLFAARCLDSADYPNCFNNYKIAEVALREEVRRNPKVSNLALELTEMLSQN